MKVAFALLAAQALAMFAPGAAPVIAPAPAIVAPQPGWVDPQAAWGAAQPVWNGPQNGYGYFPGQQIAPSIAISLPPLYGVGEFDGIRLYHKRNFYGDQTYSDLGSMWDWRNGLGIYYNKQCQHPWDRNRWRGNYPSSFRKWLKNYSKYAINWNWNTPCGNEEVHVCGDNVTYINICWAARSGCKRIQMGQCGFNGFFGNDWVNPAAYGNYGYGMGYTLGSAAPDVDDKKEAKKP